MYGAYGAIESFSRHLGMATPAAIFAVAPVSRLNSAEWLVFGDALEECGFCGEANVARVNAETMRRREADAERRRLAEIERQHRAAERRVFSDDY